ncbi:MAG: LysR family transcriptional regulator CbbR [Pararhodobacter sp.]
MRLDALTLKQLRALIAVADHRSLTAAAEALGQSVPAIHSQIKNLESAVGKALLARSVEGEGFSPTPEGEDILLAARRVEAVLSQAAARIRARTAGFQGQITLGTVSTAKYFAPRLVRMLRDRCPDIEIDLRVANREETLIGLQHGQFDLAIMGRPPRGELHGAIPLGPHPHGILLPPDHRLAEADGFDPSALISETFLTREAGSGTRILMERYLDRLSEGYPLTIKAMDSNETIKQAVIAGLGVAFLSLHTAVEELKSGRLKQLRGPGLPVMRHWYLIVPGDTPPSAAARRIAEEIEGLGGTFLPAVPVSA